MPPFPERESSILAKLKKKRPEKTQNETMIPREAKPLPPQFADSLPSPGQVHILAVVFVSFEWYQCLKKSKKCIRCSFCVANNVEHMLIPISFQNKATNNHITQVSNSATIKSVGGNTTGVLIDVLGDLGGESTTDPTNDFTSTGGGGGGVGLGGVGLGLESIVGSGVPEDNFNKYPFKYMLPLKSSGLNYVD